MTSQKAPFKHCYSFSSDQKRHLCKVTLFFQASPNISRVFADTKLWEATPWHPLRTTERLSAFPKVAQWVKRTVQFMLFTSYYSHFWGDEECEGLSCLCPKLSLSKKQLQHYESAPYTSFYSTIPPPTHTQDAFSSMIIKNKEKRAR